MISPFFKVIGITSILGSLILIAGCQDMSAKFGPSQADYAQAKELPPLKFPPGSLAVSKRYDIPNIPDINKPIIKDIEPPNF